MNIRNFNFCVALFVFVCGGLIAQTQINLPTQAKEINFSGAPYTRPVKTGTSLPANCSVGDLFFKSNAPSGSNLYGCTGPNIWSIETGAISASTDLRDFLPSVNSGVLTIQPGRIRFGTFVCTNFTTPVTASISSGTGNSIATLYISDSCAVIMEYPNTQTLALALNGVTAAAVVAPGVPATAFYIGDVAITGGSIASVTDKRSVISASAAMAGQGVVLDCASGPCLISIDTATVAQLAGNNTYSGVQDSRSATQTFPSRLAQSDPPLCVLGEQYYNTDTSTMKYCTATNNWTPAAAVAYAGTAPISVSGTTISGGGLGTVNGALKGNGSGTITQAGCGDLTNAGTGCSATLAAVATSGSATDLTSGTLPNARLAAIPNSVLANPATTVNGQTCTLGAACTIALSSVTPKSSNYQVLASDFANYKTIAVSSATFTITLVASGSQPSNGQYLDVVNYGPGVVTIARSGQNINGSTSSLTLPSATATAPSSARIISDGTNYVASLGGASGGTPGGSSGQLQYNSSGSFAGTSNWAIGTAPGAVGALQSVVSQTVSDGSSTGQMLTLSPTYTVAVGNDAKAMGGAVTVTGAANGSTWSYLYDTCQFSLTGAGSVLGHPLCNVFRQNLTTAASTTVTDASAVYVTHDVVNATGTINVMSGIKVINGGVMNGSGTVTELNGIAVSGPTALTGGLTLDHQSGITTSDIAGGGAGLHRQSISVGGAINANAGVAITVAGSSQSGTNYGIFDYAANNFFAGGIYGDGNITAFWGGGAFANTARRLQVSTDARPALVTFYNGVGGWDVGLTTTGSRWGAVDANGVEHLSLLQGATARIGIDRIAPNFPLDVNGTASATLFNTASGGSTTISSGVGSVRMTTANAATNTVWIPMSYNGTTYYVPGWTTNTP